MITNTFYVQSKVSAIWGVLFIKELRDLLLSLVVHGDSNKVGAAESNLCQTSLTATAMVEYRSLVACVPCLPSRKIKLRVKFSLEYKLHDARYASFCSSCLVYKGEHADISKTFSDKSLVFLV